MAKNTWTRRKQKRRGKLDACVVSYERTDRRTIGVECASEKRGAMRVLWESNGKSQQEISRRTRKKV